MALILSNANNQGPSFLPDDDKEGVSKMHCANCPFTGDYHELTGLPRTIAEIHLTMESPTHSLLARVISVVIMLLIFISTVAFCVETVPDMQDWPVWADLETFVVMVFTVEYVVRFSVAHRKFNFVIQFLNVIDLLAVLPWFIVQGGAGGDGGQLRVFRVIRLARVFRLFKVSRYSSYMQIMGQALKRSTDAFGLLLFFIGIAVIIFSSLMYYAEGGNKGFESIPGTFYWCIVTMTTVGYGDVVPLTAGGKMIACVAMICGILVIALPITILGQNFQDVYTTHKKPALSTVDDATTTTDTKLANHIVKLREQRMELDKTLRHLKFVLAKRTSGDEDDFIQMWSTVDYVVLTGLRRIEHFLQTVQKQEARNAETENNVEEIEQEVVVQSDVDDGADTDVDEDKDQGKRSSSGPAEPVAAASAAVVTK